MISGQQQRKRADAQLRNTRSSTGVAFQVRLPRETACLALDILGGLRLHCFAELHPHVLLFSLWEYPTAARRHHSSLTFWACCSVLGSYSSSSYPRGICCVLFYCRTRAKQPQNVNAARCKSQGTGRANPSTGWSLSNRPAQQHRACNPRGVGSLFTYCLTSILCSILCLSLPRFLVPILAEQRGLAVEIVCTYALQPLAKLWIEAAAAEAPFAGKAPKDSDLEDHQKQRTPLEVEAFAGREDAVGTLMPRSRRRG